MKISKFIKKALRVAFSVASYAVSAAVMSKVIGVGRAIASTLVITSHELGHWYSARKEPGTKPHLPIVLSTGIFTFGLTAVDTDSTHTTDSYRRILKAGPLAGLTACGALAIAGFAYAGLNILFSQSFLLILVAHELIALSPIGSDGSKLKRLRRENEEKAVLT